MRSIDKYSGGHEIYIIDGNLSLHTPNTATTEVVSILQSTSCTTGAFVVAGGVGIGKDLYVCGDLTVGGTLSVDEIVPESGTTITIGDEGTTEVTITAPDGGDGGTITLDAGEDGTVEIEGTLDYDGEITIEGDLNLDGGAAVCFSTESGTKNACIYATDNIWSVGEGTSPTGHRQSTTKNFYGHAGGLVISLMNYDNDAKRDDEPSKNSEGRYRQTKRRAGIILDNGAYSSLHYDTASGSYVYDYLTTDDPQDDPRIRYANPVLKRMFVGPGAFFYTHQQWTATEKNSAQAAFGRVAMGYSNDAGDWKNDSYQNRYSYCWEFSNNAIQEPGGTGSPNYHRVCTPLPSGIPEGAIIYGVNFYYTIDSAPKLIDWGGTYTSQTFDNLGTSSVPHNKTWKIVPSSFDPDGEAYIENWLVRQTVDAQYEDPDASGAYANGSLGRPDWTGNPGAGVTFHTSKDVMGHRQYLNDSNPARGSFGFRIGKDVEADTPGRTRLHDANWDNSDGLAATNWRMENEKNVKYMEVQRSEYSYMISVTIRVPHAWHAYTTEMEHNYGCAIRFSGCKIYYATDNPCDPAGGSRDESLGKGAGDPDGDNHYGTVYYTTGEKR